MIILLEESPDWFISISRKPLHYECVHYTHVHGTIGPVSLTLISLWCQGLVSSIIHIVLKFHPISWFKLKELRMHEYKHVLACVVLLFSSCIASRIIDTWQPSMDTCIWGLIGSVQILYENCNNILTIQTI